MIIYNAATTIKNRATALKQLTLRMIAATSKFKTSAATREMAKDKESTNTLYLNWKLLSPEGMLVLRQLELRLRKQRLN